MKIRASWVVVSAVALGCGACKHKDAAVAPPNAPVAVQPVAQAPPPAPVAKPAVLSVEQRAAKLGFVKYLPQDTEVVMAFPDEAKSAKRITSSKLWKLAQAQLGVNPSAEAAAAGDPPSLFGKEFTIALGKSTGQQTGNLLTLNRRQGYFQMRMLAKAFSAAAKTGDFAAMQPALASQYGQEMIKDLLADPESGVGLIERLSMPPVYLAFRAGDADRPAAAQQLAAMVANLGMLGPIAVPVEIEAAGQKFAGHKISGAKIAEQMEQGRKEMEGMLDPADVDKLFAAIAQKDLVVVSGILGDYAILFIGSSVADLKFAATPAQSLAAGEAMAFCDAYAAKDLAAVICGQKTAMDSLTAATGGLADMAGGLRDGLAGSDGLGDTRDLEALLRMIGERESAMRKLAGNEALGAVAYFEDGLKIESFGGSDNGALDWKSPNQLAALGDAPDVVMFANLTTEAAYDAKARAYLEALMETSYAMAMKISEIQVEDPKLTQFAAMAKMFDTKLRPDAVALWETFSGDVGDSLGRERAWIVDLKGSVPTLPGIPQAVVDQAKFPRISLVAPVTDRAKLAASWQKMNASVAHLLTKVGEISGTPLPMQKPISSEKNGYATWFFPLPFFNDDFMPSITVGDQWFAASTSKNQALDLVTQAAKGQPTRAGLAFALNFQALQTFARETLQVVETHSAAIFHDRPVPTEQLATLRKIAGAMDELDRLTVNARREGGVLRCSVHFKTR